MGQCEPRMFVLVPKCDYCMGIMEGGVEESSCRMLRTFSVLALSEVISTSLQLQPLSCHTWNNLRCDGC